MHRTDAVYSYACPSVAMVCLSLCVSVTTVSRAEADKPIEMPRSVGRLADRVASAAAPWIRVTLPPPDEYDRSTSAGLRCDLSLPLLQQLVSVC